MYLDQTRVKRPGHQEHTWVVKNTTKLVEAGEAFPESGEAAVFRRSSPGHYTTLEQSVLPSVKF